jgi:putative flippase GtrA
MRILIQGLKQHFKNRAARRKFLLCTASCVPLGFAAIFVAVSQFGWSQRQAWLFQAGVTFSASFLLNWFYTFGRKSSFVASCLRWLGFQVVLLPYLGHGYLVAKAVVGLMLVPVGFALAHWAFPPRKGAIPA